MRKTIGIIFSLLLVLSPLLIAAEKDDEKPKLTFELGGLVTTSDGYLGKVGKYLPMNDGIRPATSVQVQGMSGSTFYNLDANYRGDIWDQGHRFDIDFGRILEFKVDYTSLMHRLGHDTMFNLDTASLARSGVSHEDFNPTDEYNINYSEVNAMAKLRIPQISFVDFYAGVRNQHRSGQYQARTLSKCSSCHVVGKTRSINNDNTDYKLGTNVRVAKASFDYSYTLREYRENEAAPTNTYLKKLHPEASSPVFDSRIQYDSVDGALPFNVIPDTNKNTHLVKLSVPIADSSILSGHYSNSRIENLMTNYKMDTSSLAAGFSMLVGRRGVFNARVNRISIKNDNVFVDTVEPVDVAGPYAGQTYAEAYPTFGSADWTRKSTYNRETIDFDTSFKYRFSAKTKARLTYEFKKIDRDNYEIKTTTRHTVVGRFDWKPSRQWKFAFKGTLRATDQPFTNLYTAAAGVVQDYGVPNPFAGQQFYDFHRAREAHLTNQPTDVQEAKGIITWNPNYRFSLTVDARYRWEKNDALNFSVWSNDIINPGVNLWWTPANRLNITATYYYYAEKMKSLFAMPVLEGCGGGIIGGFPGTLTDMVDYDIDTHTVFFKLDYVASEKISLFGTFTYNYSLAKMANLILDENQLDNIPAVPPSPFDFEGVSEVVEYSNLKMGQAVTDLGILYSFNRNWATRLVGTYYHYDDLAPYLYNETGKAFSFYFSAIYSF